MHGQRIKILGSCYGVYMYMDEETKDKTRLDMARILIRTNS